MEEMTFTEFQQKMQLEKRTLGNPSKIDSKARVLLGSINRLGYR